MKYAALMLNVEGFSPESLDKSGFFPFHIIQHHSRLEVIFTALTNQQALEALWNAVGDQTFTKIISVLGGNRLYIPPTKETALRTMRDEAIREKYYAGADVPELAQKYSLSESRIRKIINQNTSGSR